MRTGRVGQGKVCKGNATGSGKTGGGRSEGNGSRCGGLLSGTKILKSLLAVPPLMPGLVTIPTFEGGTVGGWLSVQISAGGASCIGKESGEGLSDAVHD